MIKANSRTEALELTAPYTYPYDDLNGIKVGRDEELSQLVGKLLTYIDATYTDVQQRNAHKRLLKDTIYTWYYDNFDDQHSDKSLRGYSQEMIS